MTLLDLENLYGDYLAANRDVRAVVLAHDYDIEKFHADPAWQEAYKRGNKLADRIWIFTGRRAMYGGFSLVQPRRSSYDTIKAWKYALRQYQPKPEGGKMLECGHTPKTITVHGDYSRCTACPRITNRLTLAGSAKTDGSRVSVANQEIGQIRRFGSWNKPEYVFTDTNGKIQGKDPAFLALVYRLEAQHEEPYQRKQKGKAA